MNYRIHRFMNELMKLIQDAVDDGVPVYVIPYLLKDTMTTLSPVINQAIAEEAPQGEPVGETEWHLNSEEEGEAE